VTTVDSIRARAFTVPTATDQESDGTLDWDSTTMVLVETRAGDRTGLGYAYTHAAAAKLIGEKLRGVVEGADALSPTASWWAMQDAVRNLGRPGIAASAISAVDSALWDLKARLLDVSLLDLLGRVRDGIPLYGSGGFTNYGEKKLRRQLTDWVERGIRMVKIKIGREPDADPDRIRVARDAIGEDVELFVDANGAYGRKQAIDVAHRFAEHRVTWYEEPVSSDDLEGLRYVRDHTPPAVAVTAGEYGYDRFYFRRMLEAGAVDVLQADATRCMGISGFLRAAALTEAWPIALSAHTAPQLHAHVCCACRSVAHVEYFFDHERIERMFFDGVLEPEDGELRPDGSRPGNGLTFKHADAERYAA